MSDGSYEGLLRAEGGAGSEGFAADAVDSSAPPVPTYLSETYTWAYLHPRSIWLFEREWIVNLILFGNMNRLTRAVIEEIDPSVDGPALQVACVYGEFSRRLAQHLSAESTDLHIVDVAPIQIRNARRKLAGHSNTHLHLQDSSAMKFGQGKFAHTVVFFLLHEQPESVRRRTIAEALRVTRPGGKVIIVDYHRPRALNPMRYLMWPVLNTLEPFALDLWKEPLAEYLPPDIDSGQTRLQCYAGGLYQKLVIQLHD